jgi:hypothetical protein
VVEASGEMVRALEPYRALLQSFTSGALSADAFESTFTARYLADETLWPPRLFDILDALFAEADDYVGDAEFRGRVGGLDGPALRECAEVALRRLDEYVRDATPSN